MEVQYLIRRGFPYISRIHTANIGKYLIFFVSEMFGELNITVKNQLLLSLSYCSWDFMHLSDETWKLYI